MEYFDHEINDSLTARICYSRTDKQIYFVDKDDNEVAEVNLVDGVDLRDFLFIISNESLSDKDTGGDL